MIHKIDTYLENHMPELLSDLAQLVAVNSERMPEREGMPFGLGNAQCFAVAERMLHTYGFAAKNYDNYVLTADIAPELPQGLDILAHLDVVPAGDGWQVTGPFTMKIEDGKAYGRGTADDKGPAMCALYAMRAIRELSIPLRQNVRLILGADEECGSGDLDYYFTQEKSAPYSISPDAEFPLISIEKGGLHSGFHSSAPLPEALPRVTAISAGLKINIVPDRAMAILQGISEEDINAYIYALPTMDGIRFSSEKTMDGITVVAHGKTGHASEPQNSRNAITALLQLLAQLPLSEAVLHRQLCALTRLFPHGDYNGKALGVNLEDDISGKTTLTLDLLSYSAEKGLDGAFDCRACLSANDDNTSRVIYEKFRCEGLIPWDKKMYAAHHVPEESFLIQKLLDAYEQVAGERPKPLCIGGGTYVHDIDNGVAFGCSFYDTDNRMHGADEFMTLEHMLFSCKVYARAILALCGG